MFFLAIGQHIFQLGTLLLLPFANLLHVFFSRVTLSLSSFPVAFASSFANWGMTPECAESESNASSSDSVRVLDYSFGAGKTNDDVSIALSCGQRFSANASGKC